MRQPFAAAVALSLLAMLLLAAATRPEAGFDCAKAGTRTEKLICADATLARLDLELSRVYATALAHAPSRPALREAQRRWLSTQRDACGDAACLRRAYQARLEALLDEATANPSHQTLGVSANFAVQPYVTDGSKCDGLPRLPIGMAPGMCAGLVTGPTRADPVQRIRRPRILLELDASQWLVSDLGAWTGREGAIWRLRWREGAAFVEPLITGLELPHSLAWGPGERVYASEMGRIFRFDPRAANPAGTVETVIDHLPDNRLHENRHPISAFIFAADGALLVNVGAPSDQCLDARGKRAAPRCIESEQGEQAGSVRRYAPLGDGHWDSHYSVFARGLRNSVALARHPGGTLLQAENSYDFEQRFQPFEELNLLEAGRHYGWPYCYDNVFRSPGWAGSAVANCKGKEFTRPALLLPPHAAPLAMLWYQGAMFPELRGKLLMSWHGFRSVGGRIVAFDTDAKGVPMRSANPRFPTYGGGNVRYPAANAATARVLTPGWNKVLDQRPQGSPVGLAVAADGAIWTTDDRAGLVIRIARDQQP